MRVMDRPAADLQTFLNFNHRCRVKHPGIHRRRYDKGFESRSGLVHVDNRTVARTLGAECLAVIRVVAGVVRQRQDFSIIGIQYHNARCLGAMSNCRPFYFPVGEILNFSING